MLKRFKERLKNRLRKFRNSELGSAAIEFAMIAPPFMLLLGVIMETGLMMFTEYAIQSSVQDSARLVRTGVIDKAEALGRAIHPDDFEHALKS